MQLVVTALLLQTMRLPLPLFFLSITLGGVLACAEEERNVWPFYIETSPKTKEAGKAWSAMGPLFFAQPLTPEWPGDAVRARGFRPLYVETLNESDQLVEGWGLYPLLTYRRMTDGYRWSVFSLINHYSVDPAATGSTGDRGFDLWPFYFSRDTGKPESSYHAVFPLLGTVKRRFGQDRLNWVLFPLYARWEKNNVVTTTAPWPFIKVLRGEGNHGFEFWPLFGYRAKAETYREQFYLWPLIYKDESKLWQTQPDVKTGVLPFYAGVKTPDTEGKQYLLFFGYFDRTAPYRYHETDYLWPIWVQGRGDDHYINRWGPFYTHSIVKGVDKTWILWPFWRHRTWVEAPLRHTQRRLLYFLYSQDEQRSATQPTLPAARKTHLWPLISVWTNGAGKKQIQALSPFEVFFPNNQAMQLTWSPFFSVYRYNRTAPDQSEHSLLWNLVSYRRRDDTREFHFGPLFGSELRAGAKRFTVGNGLIALQRSSETGWRFSFFDFKRRDALSAAGSSSP